MLTYEEFSKYTDDIKRLFDLQFAVDKLTGEYNKDTGGMADISFPHLADNVIELLEKIMNDQSEWISYWIFELDFGELYEENSITDKDGSSIQLKTVQDLWALLTENNNS